MEMVTYLKILKYFVQHYFYQGQRILIFITNGNHKHLRMILASSDSTTIFHPC